MIPRSDAFANVPRKEGKQNFASFEFSKCNNALCRRARGRLYDSFVCVVRNTQTKHLQNMFVNQMNANKTN